MERLGIYVQVPFCQTKCTYCNFHTGVVAKERFTPYVAAVCAEIRGHRELPSTVGVEWPGHFGRSSAAPLQRMGSGLCESFAVDTIYFGGGTPSLLEAVQLEEILDTIRKAFKTEFEEVTVEADPETVENDKGAAWVKAGI